MIYQLSANLRINWEGAVSMADREERRFAEVPRESVKLMAESAGVELGDDVAALLAEDVCYRLREATQVRDGCRNGKMNCRFKLELFEHAVWMLYVFIFC